MPVSKLPPSAVAVWVTGSRLVQVTLSPALIVVVGGANAKLWIVTSWLAARAADGSSMSSASTRAPAEDSRLRAIR